MDIVGLENYFIESRENKYLFCCSPSPLYDEYYVFFFAYISDNGITLETFQDLLGSVCKLSLCHSERSEESPFLVGFQAKSEILRRSAPQNDT